MNFLYTFNQYMQYITDSKPSGLISFIDDRIRKKELQKIMDEPSKKDIEKIKAAKNEASV